MGRARYIRNRLILMVFVLFGVTVVVFGMVHFLPGDPAAILLGDRGTLQNVAELREQLGLNRPLPEQYWLFISGMVRGQLGTSLMFKQPVSEMVLSRVPITVGLAVYAMALAGVFTFVFGLLAAVNKGRWVDQVIRMAFLFILTTPNFWFGILLILVLSLRGSVAARTEGGTITGTTTKVAKAGAALVPLLVCNAPAISTLMSVSNCRFPPPRR